MSSLLNPAWVVVAACALVMFGMWNSYTGFGVFLPVLAQEFGWSRGVISGATSLQLLIGGVMAFAIGALSDRYGPRRLLFLSALVSGGAFLLSSAITALWQLYLLQGLLLGVGMASSYLVPTTTVSRWFVARRGLALGILLACHNLTLITGPPVSAFLINAFGWRTTYLVLGGLVWCIALPASAFTRFPNEGERLKSGAQWSEPGGAGEPRSAARGGVTLRRALADRRVWFLGGCWLLLGMAWMMIVIHLVSHVKDQGVALEVASLALTLFGVGAIVGRILFGVAADRLGTKSTFFLCSFLQVAALTWLLSTPSLASVYLLMVGLGMGAAGTDTTVVKAAAEVFGVRSIGATVGLLNMGWRCGATLGPAVAGFIYDATRSYTLAFALALAGLVLSSAFFRWGAVSTRPS